MSVAIDAVSNSPTTNSVSSKSWSHTVSGSNRLLLVMVQWNQPSNSETVSSVTYGGTALTQVGSNVIAGGSGLDRCTALFRLIAPTTGTATVVVTMSTSLTFLASAVSFTGVDQTTPLGTPSTATTTTAATLQTTTSSAASNLVFSAATVRTTGSLTVPSTSEWNVLIGTNNRYGGSVQSGAASVTSTYSWTGADNASMIAVDVKAASTFSISASASMAGTPLSTLTDDFASADTAKWQNAGGGAWPAQITVLSGQLDLAVQSTYHRLESVDTFDLRNSYGLVQIVQRPAQGGDGSTEMGFGVLIDANNYFSAILNGAGNIVWRTKLAGVAGTTGYTAYNSTTMRWLRWRSDGLNVYLEAAPSSNGSWTQLTSYPVTFSLAAIRPYFYAGYWGTQASPGTAIFDNFNAGNTKTISAGARLSATLTRSISAKATLVASSTLAVGGLAFGSSPSRSISATAYVQGTVTKTVSASATLIASSATPEIDLSIRPTVVPLAEEIYAALGPLTAEDEVHGWPLLRFINAIAQAPQWTEDLVRDRDAGPGWSSVVDLERAPTEALAWLAQFVGVVIEPNLDSDSQRLRIKETAGFNRGTRAAIEGAARQFLTGSRTAIVLERDTSPYHLKVVTFEAETALPDRTAAALQAQKPAGLVLQYEVSSGATCGALKATGMTCAQLGDTYPTCKAMKLAVLV
jgi:hypothetical protein